MLHLKHLGHRGYKYLTSLYNLSIQAADRPSIWKREDISLIPKASKHWYLASSFRPISPLCPSIKVLKQLLLPIPNFSLPLADSKQGFRKMRSTTSTLLPLAQKVAVGVNQSWPSIRTVAMATYLSKAFDTVNHTSLMAEISATNLHHNIIDWISAYLRDRFSSCSYKIQHRPATQCGQSLRSSSSFSFHSFLKIVNFIQPTPKISVLRTSEWPQVPLRRMQRHWAIGFRNENCIYLPPSPMSLYLRSSPTNLNIEQSSSLQNTSLR